MKEEREKHERGGQREGQREGVPVVIAMSIEGLLQRTENTDFSPLF